MTLGQEIKVGKSSIVLSHIPIFRQAICSMSRQPSGRLGQAIPTTIGELKIKLLGLAIMKILIQYDDPIHQPIRINIYNLSSTYIAAELHATFLISCLDPDQISLNYPCTYN